MIFKTLAAHIKPQLHSSKPIIDLVLEWMRHKMQEAPPEDNVSRILQAEFRLHHLASERGQRHSYVIVPRSDRAANLLKLMRNYAYVMEERRLEKFPGT
jgi:hypothetical protein